jgi:hypothetical protein
VQHAYFLINTTTQSTKAPGATTEMQINNTISFLHRVNEETDAYDDDSKEE